MSDEQGHGHRRSHEAIVRLCHDEEKESWFIKLQDFSDENDDISCEEILDDLFQLTRQGVTFNLEENAKIKTYCQKSIIDILKYLRHIGILFHPCQGISPLELRTAFELIVEAFKLNSQDSKEKVLEQKVETVRNYLNAAIDKWKKFVLSEEGCEHYSMEDLVRPEYVPSSHTWWLCRINSEP
jgi:hypothetical protein